MGRILAIDYGKKRTGIAVSDPLQISINPMPTILTDGLYAFIENYLRVEVVETLVIGYPTHKDGTPTYLVKDIEAFLSKLIKKIPSLDIVREDEFNTSRDARNNMILMGVKKKKRQQKEEVDKGSAVLILKSYLNRKFML
ncbi:MAG: Holliday junction resolvase RuvX [Saprospiraceae bacterium]|nr:Holliday junction resolvase RuvX [Saprospiraceae bacterium]